MKVAIIGAELSGLACAHELEMHGIPPEIYEQNDFIEDRDTHVSAILTIVDRPIADAIQYFHNTCI